MIEKLESLGLTTELETAAAGSELPWLCLVKRAMVPDEQTLFHLGVLLEVLAADYGGDFDGWESDIVTV